VAATALCARFFYVFIFMCAPEVVRYDGGLEPVYDGGLAPCMKGVSLGVCLRFAVPEKSVSAPARG
jgi:hypothetical protein